MNTSAELRQLQMSADAFELALADDSWFELMHWHPDIYGTGNASTTAREACTILARQYLSKAMGALRGWSKPSQCWCLLDPADSGQDAVYVHTENPNRPNFPYQFEGVTWSVEAPAWVAAAFPPNEFMVGSSGQIPELLYWVVERASHPLVNIGLVRTCAPQAEGDGARHNAL